MAKTRLEIPMTEGKKSCVKGFIGWERLEIALRLSDDIRPHEIITHFEIVDNGIQFGVEKEGKTDEIQ